MNICVTDAFEVTHHRHARVFLDPCDEPFATARHDDVYELRHVAQQDAYRLAVLGRDSLNRTIRKLCSRKALK